MPPLGCWSSRRHPLRELDLYHHLDLLDIHHKHRCRRFQLRPALLSDLGRSNKKAVCIADLPSLLRLGSDSILCTFLSSAASALEPSARHWHQKHVQSVKATDPSIYRSFVSQRAKLVGAFVSHRRSLSRPSIRIRSPTKSSLSPSFSTRHLKDEQSTATHAELFGQPFLLLAQARRGGHL